MDDPPPLLQAPPQQGPALEPEQIAHQAPRNASPHKSSASKKKHRDDGNEFNPLPPSKRVRQSSRSQSRSVPRTKPDTAPQVDVFEFVGSPTGRVPSLLSNLKEGSKRDGDASLATSKDGGNVRKRKRDSNHTAKSHRCDEEREREQDQDQDDEEGERTRDCRAAVTSTKRKKRDVCDDEVYALPQQDDEDEEDVWLPSRRHSSKSKREDEEGQTRRATRRQGSGDLVPPLPRPKRPRRKKDEGRAINDRDGKGGGTDEISRASSKRGVDGMTDREEDIERTRVKTEEDEDKDDKRANLKERNGEEPARERRKFDHIT